MVIYSSAPRASIDGAWESRFDTVRSYSLLSESGVRDPSGIFTFLYRSLFLKPVDDPSFSFQFLPPQGTPSFRVSPSTFMVSLELTSSIFQDSSRERIFLYGLVQSLMITFRRKRANWKVNIILREKVSNFIIIYLRIEKFLDRRSTYVREGREGEGRNSRWGKVQRHEAIGLSLPWSDRGRLRLVAFPGKHSRTAYRFARSLHLDVLIFPLI